MFPEFDFEGKGVILGKHGKIRKERFPQLLNDAPEMKLQLALGADVLEELHDRIRLTTLQQALES